MNFLHRSTGDCGSGFMVLLADYHAPSDVLYIRKWNYLPVDPNRLPNEVNGLYPAASLTIASHLARL